ncbi:MAG: S46 family peptidase [Phycisphaerales bacterium]|nr:S46 family peptidase [Phycisphaerales bacterium]
MRVNTSGRAALLTAVAAMVCSGPAVADEGMWLFNGLPREALQSRYRFEPSAEWLQRVQGSALQFDGASGSFVSGRGLVLTNHHVGSDQIHKLSTPERDLMRDGFVARTLGEEIPCADLVLRSLTRIEDVTAEVQRAAEGLSGEEAGAARRAAISRIESAARKAGSQDASVVTLYHGARHHLYHYRRYSDVRLVFAPHSQIAAWGGDYANFGYPRFCLDMCLFRVYENGKPLEPEHYLRWSEAGAADGDLVLVAGHPWRTQRLLTVDHVRFVRDVDLPHSLFEAWRRESIWQQFVNRGPDERRIGLEALGGVQNRRKARAGVLAGLLDPAVMDALRSAEQRVRGKAQIAEDAADPWQQIGEACDRYRQFHARHVATGGNRPFRSALTSIALNLVRLAEELPKPSGERLAEYRDTALDGLYVGLYSPAPIHPEFETESIAAGLSYLAESFGAEDPLVTALLDGRSPRARAEQLVGETKLADVAERRRLAEGGRAAIEANGDPLLRFVRAWDAEERRLRARHEREVGSVLDAAYARIAAVRFELDGDRVYPDATGTLRFSFGPVRGYVESGRTVPPFTTYGGLLDLHAQRADDPACALPPVWSERRGKLNPQTPLNFVCTADIIGGNSGSPALSRAGEVVGVIFDGNIQSLIWDMRYTDEQARAVCVDSRGILEALRVMYDAPMLADELQGR